MREPMKNIINELKRKLVSFKIKFLSFSNFLTNLMLFLMKYS